MTTIPISLEFFPPKTEEGSAKLRAARRQLYALKPEFCSVTFGAGGSTQEGTLQAVKEIMAEGTPGAPHMSCIGQTRDTIRERLAAYDAAGVRCQIDHYDASHGWAVPDFPVFDEAAAERHWGALERLYREAL